MKIDGDICTDYGDHNMWLLNHTNLVLRAGTFGFICKEGDWGTYGRFTDNSNNPEFFKPIDTRLGLCLRVFLKDLGSIKIPQLALYPPEVGYPLCAPERTPAFRKGSRSSVYAKSFFTIPMLHVNYGLARQLCSNVYTVFFSNSWEKKTPFSHPSETQTYNEKYVTFPTGINKITPVLLKNYFATWPVELDFTDNDNLDIYFVAGNGPHERMDYDAFHRYLAYWKLYYPLASIKIKGQSYGSAGGTLGAFQGYFKYESDKDDAFVGRGDVWATYFGIKEDCAWNWPLNLGWSGSHWKFNNLTSYSVQGGVSDYQVSYQGIKDTLWQELAVVRSFIKRSNRLKEFKYYPFSSKAKQKSFGRTMIHEGPAKQLSTISQLRYNLDKGSKLEAVPNKHCPLCMKDLILPAILAKKIRMQEIMCVSCGFKALNNIHYLSVKNVRPNEDNCMWFNDIDMKAVLNDKSRITVGAGMR